MSNPATPNLRKAGKPNLHGVGTANSPPAKGEYPEGGRGFLPKLRFPEFRDSVQWEMMKFGEIASKGKETFDPQKSNETPRLIELENIESRTGRILGFTEIKNQSSLKQRFQAGDVLFGKLRPYLQKFARPRFTGICTTEIWVLRSEIVLNSFLFYLVQTKRFTQLANISSGSRMPRAEWSFLADSDFGVPHPDEQQKIADCLNSLDDLIAAENQKLEALRRHKQGLMQQLFPQAGETVPRLRFPEFKDSPDWKKGKCLDIADVLPGYGFPDRFQGNSHGQHPFYKVSDISQAVERGDKYIRKANNYIETDVLKKIRAKLVPTGTIIFAKIGEAIRSNRRVITTTPAVIDNNTAGLKFKSAQCSNEFLFYLWSKVALSDHAGGVVPAVSKSALQNIPLCYPNDPAEQKRIADCLSTLDSQIGAQLTKLDALRAHKQGLMQQLFPSLEVYV